MARPRSGRRSARAAETGRMVRRGEEAALASRLPVLRAELERQRHFRRQQLALIDTAYGKDVSSADPGPTDCRDDEASYALHEVDALVMAGARRALADIELALLRMRTGRYGLCRSCGTRIPVVVLEAVPKTTLCLACHYRSEGGNAAQGGARTRSRVAPRRKARAERRR